MILDVFSLSCVCVCVSQKFLKPAGSRSQPLGRARPPPAGSLGLGPLSHRPPDYVHTLLRRCRASFSSNNIAIHRNKCYLPRVKRTSQDIEEKVYGTRGICMCIELDTQKHYKTRHFRADQLQSISETSTDKNHRDS